MNSTLIVTGGGSGIGRAVALALAGAGQHVTIAGRREAPLREVAAHGPSDLIDYVSADLATPEGAAALTEHLDGRPVDGFVAAAGGQGGFYQDAPGPQAAHERWTAALHLNLMSAVLPIEALLPTFTNQRARVVLVSSTAALDGAGGPYATAKAALHGYAMDLARRLGSRQITANVVAPGFIDDTGFFDNGFIELNEQARQHSAAQTLIGRLGHPQDITSCIQWLLSDQAGWTTGQVISPNGGTNFVH